MYRDEFWIGLILLGILILKGFLGPVSEKIDRCFLDVPVVPKVVFLFETEHKWFNEWVRPALGHEHPVFSRHQPSTVPPLISFYRAPVREEWKRG